MECVVYKTVRSLPLSPHYIEKIVFYVLNYLKKDASMSVHCIGDKKMRRLNVHYRHIDKTTDVLSFSNHEGEYMPGEHIGGDIFLCIPQIRRQAKNWNVSFKEEFTRMLIHGMLHSFGFDHVVKKDADKMFALQEDLLNELL